MADVEVMAHRGFGRVRWRMKHRRIVARYGRVRWLPSVSGSNEWRGLELARKCLFNHGPTVGGNSPHHLLGSAEEPLLTETVALITRVLLGYT